MPSSLSLGNFRELLQCSSDNGVHLIQVIDEQNCLKSAKNLISPVKHDEGGLISLKQEVVKGLASPFASIPQGIKRQKYLQETALIRKAGM
jgi:hypothetical protein